MMKNNYKALKLPEYLETYSKIFSSSKDDKISLFELGIWEGGSLLIWQDYFKNGTIVGLDLNIPDLSTYNTDRIEMFLGSQTDIKLLTVIGEKYKQFDIIIDDCSHISKNTKISFDCLLPYVKSGGVYIIEDWQIDFHDNIRGDGGMTKFIKSLIEEQMWTNILSIYIIPPMVVITKR
jgi:demethylmacrocin O-methyltransferase